MIVSWFPYIRAGWSSEKYFWLKILALLPLGAAAVWSDWQTYLVRSLLVLTLCGLFLVAARLRGVRGGFIKARYLYLSWLIILLLPGSYPWYLAWIFPALGLGLSLLGDDDQRLVPLNAPAIILALWLAIHFRQYPASSGAGQWLWWKTTAISPVSGALLAASALAAWLLLRPYYKFRIQAGFILFGLFLSGLSYYNQSQNAIPGWETISAILIGGTFLIPDEPASPKGFGPQIIFGAMAALIFALFMRRGGLYQAMVFSALIPSLLSPWLDEFAAYGWKIYKISEDR